MTSTIHGARLLALAVTAMTLVVPSAAGASQGESPAGPVLLAEGLQGAIGSTVGPDGALYVAEGVLGQITRIDPCSGEVSTFASGLPPAPFGGAIDVGFVGGTAYALVTLVAPDHPAGIYRIEDDGSATVVADLGAFSVANPVPYPVDVPTGLQFALQPVDDGFLVSDGHHNRVLHATLDGVVTERFTFDNVVPAGLEVRNGSVFVSQTGPVPHTASQGKVTAFSREAPTVAREVAAGFGFLVDVEFGPHGVLYALSQGDSPGDVPPGSPALPDSGELLRVDYDGTFSVVLDGLDRPTSLDFAGDRAYVVTLGGEVWRIDDVSERATGDGTPGGDR